MREIDKYEIVIQDACILFDLVDLILLEEFFQLDFSVFTTPQVIEEIKNEVQLIEITKFLNIGKLKVDSEGIFEEILTILEKYPGLSFADSSVLELALRKNAIIFSSDGSLRKISVRNNLTVRGTLWIIEELHAKAMISRDLAIEKLNTYSLINQRAPIKHIENLISKLRKY